MKKWLVFLVACLYGGALAAQSPLTFQYAQRDTAALLLDVYVPASSNGYTVLHMFGGGFFTGGRNEEFQVDYCRTLAENGYTAVSIDYRLGLRGVKNVGVTNISAIEHAITVGVEDCCDAVVWLLAHSDELGIAADKIIVEGSSAGAVLALETDYAHANRLPMAAALPDGFRFAGVVAYAGAVFSRQGKVAYQRHAPAPVMMVHGTADRIVNYRQTAVANTGLYGTNALVKRFQKYNYPYYALRYTGLGHEVATFGIRTIELLNLFVENWLKEKRPLSVDTCIKDADTPPGVYSAKTADELFAPDNRKDVAE